MKFVLFSLILISACVPSKDLQNPDTIAEVIQLPFEPKSLAEEDLNNIKLICASLEKKERQLPDLVGQKFQFSMFQKNCENTDYLPEEIINLSLSKPGQQYIFIRNDGGIVPFPFVETVSDGVMKPICANLVDLRSPLQISPNLAIWFTTNTSPRHCKAETDSVCIQIQKGEYVSDINYRIHTSEWIKFKVQEDLTGFFSERKLKTRLGCSSSKSFEKKVLLRN